MDVVAAVSFAQSLPAWRASTADRSAVRRLVSRVDDKQQFLVEVIDDANSTASRTSTCLNKTDRGHRVAGSLSRRMLREIAVRIVDQVANQFEQTGPWETVERVSVRRYVSNARQ